MADLHISIKRTWRTFWLRYEWVVDMPAYGFGMGFTWTKRGAQRKADHCAVEFLSC
jgi:hypothetical protein